jgi:hypothetical protein
MLKTLSITLLLFMLLSIIAPNNAAAALPCNPKILNACYDSCKKLFSDPILQTSCYAGCLIGCVTSGTD